MKLTLLFAIVIMFTYSIHAQPNIEWTKFYGGTQYEEANDIRVTPDGGTIMTGLSYSIDGDVTGHHGSVTYSDFWVVKTDAAGDLQWQKSYGGDGSDFAESIELTADGGYLVAGFTNSANGDVTVKHGKYDFWILKLNASGVIQKQLSLGGTKDDEAYDAKPTPDGGFIVVGSSNSVDDQVTGNHGKADFWVVKVNATGVIQWQRSLGGKQDDIAYSVQLTSDGGYIVAGSSKSKDGDVTDHHSDGINVEQDYWVVKLNSSGITEWTKSLGGTWYDECYSVIVSPDGNYLVAGYTGSADGDVTSKNAATHFDDYWVVKLNSSGNILWEKSYGGGDHDVAYSISNATGGGYLVAGKSESGNGDVIDHIGNTGDYSPTYNAWIVKTDNNGNFIARQSLQSNHPNVIQPEPDGGCVLAGLYGSPTGDSQDFWVVKMKFLFYTDQDQDGFGDSLSYVVNTFPPPGYVDNHLDCNDQDNHLNPSITDIQDGIDNNCDNSIDEPYVTWQSSLGGMSEDYATSIDNTQEGGYVVAGYSYSIDGDVTGHHGATDNQDFWITKLNSSGNLQWQRSLGGTKNDAANAVVATSDGGCIVAGSSGSIDGDVTGHHGAATLADAWVVKLDASGVLQWQKSLGGTLDDVANAIALTPDGGYILSGYSKSNDGDVTGHHGPIDSIDYSVTKADYWVAKLDASGNLQWQKSLGGTADDVSTSIETTSDGGYIVGGHSYSNNGNVTVNYGVADYWIVKLDAIGGVQWQHSYGGSSYDNLHKVRQTSDGGYIVIGDGESSDHDATDHHVGPGAYDGWIVKTDALGNIQWSKSIGGTADEFGTDVIQLGNGDYVVTASAASLDGDLEEHYGPTTSNFWMDYWALQLDASGNIMWKKIYGGNFDDHAYAMTLSQDGGMVLSGASASDDIDVSGHHGETGTHDFWVVKLNVITGVQSIATTVSGTTLCPGQTFNVNYNAIGSFNAGNIFTAQLSDANGNFSSPVNIGSLSSTFSASISCSIPPLTTPGTGYRIRVVSSNPFIIGSDNGADIIIICPAPSNLISSNITSSKATLSWNVVSCAQGYQIRYRKLGSTTWTMVNVSGTSKNISGLEPSTTYQWSVKTKCYSTPKITSSFAPNQTFTTAPLKMGDDVITAVKVYPNPFHQTTYIDLSSLNWPEDHLEIRITDLSGKILFQKTYSNQTEIEIGNKLPVGFYLVEVKGNHLYEIIPIVKSN